MMYSYAFARLFIFVATIVKNNIKIMQNNVKEFVKNKLKSQNYYLTIKLYKSKLS